MTTTISDRRLADRLQGKLVRRVGGFCIYRVSGYLPSKRALIGDPVDQRTGELTNISDGVLLPLTGVEEVTL